MALRQDEFTSLTDDVDLDRDRALVERCQAGDSAAFGNLYARYYERLLRFCMRRLNDRHEAEDAAQEAFARAWKALPQFAGERRFYPWLTVIAGNICTDMLRRRSRSTPTEDVELGSHQPVGGGSSGETSEELVLASVDGELVNRALGRLSTRHRHVLAMREGSGWSYQQIADHEGVEIGTIETLLWRARQALKREFAVLSESKGVLAGFLAGTGAFFKRSMFRVAHRSSMVQGSGTGGGLRNAMIGGAVTSAAVAAALITPHALSTPHTAPPVQAAGIHSATNNAANPSIPVNTTPAPVSDTSSGSGDSGGGSDTTAPIGTGNGPERSTVLRPSTSNTPSLAAGNGSGNLPGVNTPSGPNLNVPGLSGLGSGITTPVVQGLSQVTTSLTQSVGAIASSLGLSQVLSQLGLVTPTAGTTTSTTNPLSSTINQATGAVTKTLNKTLGPILGKK